VAGFAPLEYAGAGRRLVAALKFARLLAVARLAASLIAERAPAGLLRGVIVPVPPAAIRLAGRGFDPAEEIASELAVVTGLPLSACLRRRDSGHQRGRSRSRRLAAAPRFAPTGAAPPLALLVDDVTTTGATIDACARALRRGGSERVVAVALAAVPGHPALPVRGRAA
jgi:predicted amidophosphoribosyltransferase